MAKNKIANKIKQGLKVLGLTVGMLVSMSYVNASISGNLPKSEISDTFPSSYQRYIDKLKIKYPNAIFKVVYTNLDWETAVSHESYDVNSRISTIHSSFGDEWKKDGINNYIDGPYVTASRNGVAYVLDPRNSLYPEYIFQFEGLTYASSIGNDVIEKVLAGTLLVGDRAKQYKNAGEWVDMDMSYAEIIRKVGQELNVSSVYIASRMKQETGGRTDTNGSINGSSTEYPGVYNFFNIGATPGADGVSAVMNGLKTAKTNGWTTPYLSIYGGVNIIKNNYIKWGQDTVYFQKFDVNNPYGNAKWLMGSQYQTNILAPRSESQIAYNGYKNMGLLDSAFVFYIPVYNNMPEDAAPYPAGDNASFVSDNTKVYLDDTKDVNVNDVFKIRSSANDQLDNVIYTLTEIREGADNRVLMTRTKKGQGYDWDYVEFIINGECIKGYVAKEYVMDYNYTKVSGVELNLQNVTMEIEETRDIVATVAPQDAKFKDVNWTSSNTHVVTVNGGRIEAKGIGTALVTATTFDQGKTAICNVIVTEKIVSINMDKDEYFVTVGENITPQIALRNATNYTLTIQDETMATINNGVITGVTSGNTKIIAKITGTDITKEALLHVVSKLPEEISFSSELSISATKIITKVTPSTTFESLKEKITMLGLSCRARDISGNELANDKNVGTGTVLEFLDSLNQVVDVYTVVIHGDVNGDGAISAKDYIAIRNHIMETKIIDGIAASGADVNKDNGISAKDYIAIRNHIMEVQTISQ